MRNNCHGCTVMKWKNLSNGPVRPSCMIWPAIVLACLIVLTIGCSKKDDGDTERLPVAVYVMNVSTGPVEDVLRFTGDVRARRDVRVLSQVGERIVDLTVDRGDEVEEGKLLAVVENSLLRHVVVQAEAGVESARSSLNNIESEYGRAKRLLAQNAISRQQYETRKTQLENARSALRQAEAVLDQSRTRYSNSYIRAPFSGIISNRFVELGDMVSPGSPVFSLVEVDMMRVTAQISEQEFARIIPGQKARLSLASLPGLIAEGTVVKKTPILDPLSRLATVEVLFDNSQGTLVPGMFGELDIIVNRKEAVPLVPASALLYSPGGGNQGQRSGETMTRAAHVFVVDTNIALRRDVVTGYRQGGMVEIVSGIEPGDVLVVRGHHALENGTPVVVGE